MRKQPNPAATGWPPAGEGKVRQLLQERADDIRVTGIPADVPAPEAALFRARVSMAFSELHRVHPSNDLAVTVRSRPLTGWAASDSSLGARTPPPGSVDQDREALSREDRASYFRATEPLYTFDRLVLPAEVMDQLMMTVEIMTSQEQIFDRWDLRSIEPHPSSAINFHGPPGTGKTLAAHAIASRLGQKIIEARCSQLESKYHGEGPKNLDALFYTARSQQAVLFLDEAESLMSQRYEHTSQGSEHAVNAMRSELFQALDRFEGLAIFATNLAGSYDTAFDSRVRHIRFLGPDTACRAEIWRRHLPPGLPLDDVDIDELATIEEVTGREIKNAVIAAAAKVLLSRRDTVTQSDLVCAIEQVKANRIQHDRGFSHTNNALSMSDDRDREAAAAIARAASDVGDPK